MNIFILDSNPKLAAQYMCDKHIPKMLLESAQMLCSTFHLQGINAPYKLTHKNHPCNVWIRESRNNYEWLLEHAREICSEYTFRFGKRHKSHDIIDWCLNRYHLLTFSEKNLTPFSLAMPVQYKTTCSVESYRRYYIGEKSSFAKWIRGRETPAWFTK